MDNLNNASVFKIDNLNDACVFEVLKRLSPEDLLKLHRAGPKFYSTIRHPYFMKTSLLRHQHSDNILVQTFNEEEGLYESSIYSVQNNGQLGYPKAIRYLEEWKIHGACNGLLLVQHCYQLDALAITNPLLKITFSLPRCNVDVEIMEKSSFAFLFVAATQTYHVIHIFETKPSNSVQCWALELKYNSSEEELGNLLWTQLWGENFLGHDVRCSANPICLNDGVVIWKLSSDENFLAWDVGAGSVRLCPLPGALSDDEDVDGNNHKEYFLLNRGGSLAYVDYDETSTVARVSTLDWITGEWMGLWDMDLSNYDDLVGYEVDAILPHFISKNGNIMILNIDGHVFKYNSDIGSQIELGGLSGKDIRFCSNHVNSIVSLKKAVQVIGQSQN